jgi:hypothetical protein
MGKKPRAWDEAGHPVSPIPHFKKKVFDEWPLKNGETVRVSTDCSSGFDLVHIRRRQRGPTGQLYPTEKGIAVQIGHLQRLLKALKQVRAHAREIALLPKLKRQSIHRGWK